MADICPICGNKIPFMTKTKVVDGNICALCANIAASHKTMRLAEIKALWQENQSRYSRFRQTTSLSSMGEQTVVIDAEHKMFYIAWKRAIGVLVPQVYLFSEVEEYSCERLGGKTVTKKKGGLGRAVVGSALFGGTGAIVGAVTAKEETKTVGGRDAVKVTLATKAGKKVETVFPPSGFVEFLDRCMEESEEDTSQTGPALVADELVKLKALLDQGILTDEEFSAQKAKLLG